MELSMDVGPLARLEEVKGDVVAPGVVFARVCEGETLGEIAKAWGLPKGRFIEWYTTAHAEMYDAALKVRADELAHGALADAEGATVETVSADKLRVETKLRVAGKWDRKRYGEDVERVTLVPVTLQIGNLRGGGEVEKEVVALPSEVEPSK